VLSVCRSSYHNSMQFITIIWSNPNNHRQRNLSKKKRPSATAKINVSIYHSCVKTHAFLEVATLASEDYSHGAYSGVYRQILCRCAFMASPAVVKPRVFSMAGFGSNDIISADAFHSGDLFQCCSQEMDSGW
jgi:hypothetical protein